VLHRLFSEPMVYICPAGHPLSRRSRVTVSDLQGRILRPPPGWGSRAAIDDALGSTSSADEVSNYSLLADLVRVGFGTTLAPASALRGDMLAGLHTVPVEDSRLRWTLSAAVPHRRTSAAASVLLDALVKGSAGRS
jgi:DNA-binding transcriptional LysR family regulator